MKIQLAYSKSLNKKAETTNRSMDHIEKALLQNQEALASTLSDMENRYTTSLSHYMNTNATLLNRIVAMEMQIHSLQTRVALAQGNGRTAA